MKQRLTIIKIGGALMESDETITNLANILGEIPGHKVVVHGGGRKASDLSEKLGIEIEMIEGRRITNKETLDVATMVYAGLYNKQLVSQFQKNNVRSLGMSGADLNIITSRKRPVRNVDYGFVGDIIKIDTSALSELFNLNIVPVFCAITHDNNGQLLNTNADTIATMIAVKMADQYAVDLLYCMDKKGVLEDPDDDDSAIAEIDYKRYKTLKMNGKIKLGLIPKMDNAFYALVNNVADVWICNIDGLMDYPTIKGTRICQ